MQSVEGSNSVDSQLILTFDGGDQPGFRYEQILDSRGNAGADDFSGNVNLTFDAILVEEQKMEISVNISGNFDGKSQVDETMLFTIAQTEDGKCQISNPKFGVINIDNQALWPAS